MTFLEFFLKVPLTMLLGTFFWVTKWWIFAPKNHWDDHILQGERKIIIITIGGEKKLKRKKKMQKKRKKEKRRNYKTNPPWKKKKIFKKLKKNRKNWEKKFRLVQFCPLLPKWYIMKLADNLFAEPCWNVPKLKYPSTKYNDVIVDNCCMQQQFDALLHCGQFL